RGSRFPTLRPAAARIKREATLHFSGVRMAFVASFLEDRLDAFNEESGAVFGGDGEGERRQCGDGKKELCELHYCMLSTHTHLGGLQVGSNSYTPTSEDLRCAVCLQFRRFSSSPSPAPRHWLPASPLPRGSFWASILIALSSRRNGRASRGN